MTASAAATTLRLDDAARDRLVSNIVGHLLDGVTEPVLQRAFGYWRNVDTTLGNRIEVGVRAGQETGEAHRPERPGSDMSRQNRGERHGVS